MEATQRLREEHQVILKVLGCFERSLNGIEAGAPVDQPTLEKFVVFFRGFADHCHHCKEEQRLFPVLESAGMPREGGPIGCMISEHEAGRQLVGVISDHVEAAGRGEQAAVETVIEHGHMFIHLLRNHIAKEDNILFNMADGVLTESQRTDLVASYDQAEAEPEYCARLDRSRAVADELIAQFGATST